MDANEVNMVAIGLEEIGADDFVEEGFFDGGTCVCVRARVCLNYPFPFTLTRKHNAMLIEMYIDQKRKTYENLNYKRFNFFNIFLALLSAASRAAISESNSRGIKGNLTVGDGLQNGGLLVIDKGGAKVLLNHREENPGDHAANETILQSLGIKELVPVR